MSENNSRYQIAMARLFIISIIFSLLQACVSPHYSQQKPERHTVNRPPNHKVIAGETLFSIAWRYGLKYEDLAKYNRISKPYRIYPGQLIRLDVPKKAVSSGGISKPLVSGSRGKRTTAYSKNSSSKNQSNTLGNPASRLPQDGSLIWSWPVKGTILKRFSGAQTLDKGIDIAGKLGEPVLAAAPGHVIYAGSGLRGYGKLLIIRHSDSFLSAYAHNDKLLVKEGDPVKAGQRIADMGSSGTDKVKLHFEIRRDGTPEDPLKYLPRR